MKVEEIKVAFNTNIQFAISDDLKSAVSSLDGATSAVNKSIANYDASYKAMQAEATRAKSVVATQMKLINTAEAKAKELGISPSVISGYAEANKAWGIANASIDKVNEF